MKHEKLLWDCEFFGFDVGSYRVINGDNEDTETIITNAYASGIKLLYLFTNNPLNNAHLLKKFNGLLVDKKVIFSKTLQKTSTTSSIDITEYTENFVSDELKDLAYQSGEHSRFKIDYRLPSGTFSRLYDIWIENSVNKKFASKIFIFKIDGAIAGFITLSLKENYGDIGLIAVNGMYRGMEIGSKLIQHTELFIKNQGKMNLKVTTQIDNQGACNFYTKNGFDIESISHIYHFMNQYV